ncbi:hypothetical protein TWF481_011406 [Arthrobotrys musiformis]|uniref:C2H2-type domain-containing protein n=1 Tax=Arthrobotrys musiformis TaxID=47236 RepID=A0AAV9VYC1_9PEZI
MSTSPEAHKGAVMGDKSIGLFGHCELCVRDAMGVPDERLKLYATKAELDENKATHSMESIKNRAMRPWPASYDGFKCPVEACGFNSTLGDGYLGLWRHVAGEHEGHFREVLLL